MSLWHYCPDDVSVLIAGVYRIEGFVDGTMIDIVKDLQPYKTFRSVDGMVGRSRVTNSTHTINLNIMASSPDNDVLTKWWQFDTATGLGQLPIMVKDSLGTGYFFSPACWIEGIPSLSYAVSAGERQWVLRCNEGLMNIGGNDKEGTLSKITTLALSGAPLLDTILEGVF